MSTIPRYPPRRWAHALLVAGTFLLAASPARAQSAASAIDQPTPATLPPSMQGTGGDHASPDDQKSGRVSAPSALGSSTNVMAGDRSSQGKGQTSGTDPVKHLPKDMR